MPGQSPEQARSYGPKLEFELGDRLRRRWQCGTIQLDFVLPERFELSYDDSSGARVRPAMLHRAMLGSLERFLGILLEHHEGRLPAWLLPQVRVRRQCTPSNAATQKKSCCACGSTG